MDQMIEAAERKIDVFYDQIMALTSERDDLRQKLHAANSERQEDIARYALPLVEELKADVETARTTASDAVSIIGALLAIIQLTDNPEAIKRALELVGAPPDLEPLSAESEEE